MTSHFVWIKERTREETLHMKNKGALEVLLCYIAWGILPIFWKQLSSINSVYVLANRVIWSCILAAGILAFMGGKTKIKAVFDDKKELGRMFFACISVCINWGVYIWAVNNNHMIDASLAYYMNPIMVILLGTLVFKEKLNKLQWIAVIIAFTGIIITSVRYHHVPWVALVIGGSFAIYGAVKKEVHSDAITASFFETLIAIPFFLILVIWMEYNGMGAMGTFHGVQWILLPLCGVVTSVPLLYYSAGIKKTSMSLSGILMYINPTLQLLLSVWLYGEEFTKTNAILFGFVWASLVLYLIAEYFKTAEQ